MVIADLGMCVMAEPGFRLQKRLRSSDNDLGVCTLNYRPPDVCLGSQRYQDDLDMWSLGCVAAELYMGHPLFLSSPTREPSVKDFVGAIFVLLGPPRTESSTWLESLPFFKALYGTAAATAGGPSPCPSAATAEWPPPCLAGCPKGLADLVQRVLQWRPSDRIGIAAAKAHSFLQPPGAVLTVRLDRVQGKNGIGTIAEANLDPDLLRYLQTCPSWNSLAQQCLESKGPKRRIPSKCVRKEDSETGLKSEFVGIVNEKRPSTCRSLNSDANLHPIPSKRFAVFVRAVRIAWRSWLEQLTQKMRKAVGQDNMPEYLYAVNGKPILEEEFADNAFAYASIQVMKPGQRDDGWHTDGGSSLLHASVTLFGTRTVQVRMDGEEEVNLAQEPGSFYVGNLCALEHNVRHHEECKHTFDGAAVTAKGDGKDLASAATAKGDAEDPAPAETAKGDQRRQIAVMIRSDVFRNFRARKINSTPGPVEFFRVVNRIVAQHLANVPVALPDLTEVLAEVARTATSNMALTS